MGRPGYGCIILALLVVAACVRSDTDACGDGTTCRAGTFCVHAREDLYVCAPDDARDVCTRASLADGVLCAEGSGRCYDGACVPIACGDRLVDPGDAEAGLVAEMCDDGNTVSGDHCSADCRSDERCGNGVVDPANEVCDDGNPFSSDGCDTICQPELPSWRRVIQDAPPPFTDPAMAFDPVRGEAILFGDGTGVGLTYRLDSSWTRVQTALQPLGRTGGAMTFDSARQRVVLVGGDNGSDPSSLGDTWTWDGNDWVLASVGTLPVRARAGLVYDAKRERVVLFGGAAKRLIPTPLFLDDTWEWDGSTWTEVATTTRPSARADAAMAYDPTRGVTVLFGGTGTTVRNSETWEFDGTTWRLVTPAVSPPPLVGAQMVAYHGKLLLFGGTANVGDRNDTWLYDGATWEKLADTAIVVARHNHAMVYDSSRDRVIAFGGDTSLGPDLVNSKTFVFDGTAWKQEKFSDQGPGGVPTAAYDAARGRALVAIGASAYQLADNAWTLLEGAPGTLPDYAMAFDRARDRAIMFGGVSAQTFAFVDDKWSPLAPQPVPSPPVRNDHTMAFDRDHDEIVLYGGINAGPTADDTWVWTGAAWELRDAMSMPGIRMGPVLGHDPIRHQTILFGGSYTDDRTFAWTGTAWSEIGQAQPSTQRPLPRAEATMTWNPVRGRLTMFGGASVYADTGLLDDVWEWDGERWTEVPITGMRPEPRRFAGLVPDSRGLGLYMFAGVQASTTPGDLWQLAWKNATPRDRCLDERDSDLDDLAGCADPDCWSVCHPMCEPGVDCTGVAGCGDGVPSPTETCRMCPGDVGATCEICGDAFCASSEDSTSCAADCQ